MIQPRRVAVVGGRKFDDYSLMRFVLNTIPIKLVISGGAKGADTLAERYADEQGIEKLIFLAQWRKNGVYDPTAGFKRNQQLIEEGKPDLVMAFQPGEGTKNTIKHAQRNNIEIRVFRDEITPAVTYPARIK